MKIGSLAEELGVSVRTIRYYEERGLLHANRTEGNTRYYDNDHLQRLRAILKLADAGLSIDTIYQLSAIRQQAANGHQSQYKLSREIHQITDQLTHQIEKLTAIQSELGQARELIHGCRNCQNKPTSQTCPDCPVPRTVNAAQRLPSGSRNNRGWTDGDERETRS